MTDRDIDEAVAESYEAHRDEIWGLCYQMTGSRAEADDLAQTTFLRLKERPPDDLSRSLKSWLMQVAANLARDRLRERQRLDYTGEWLPTPLVLDDTSADANPEHRYGQLESVRYGFLVALERLSANQRSVLLLRDVYGLTVRETAEALDLSRSNVKVTHHRARKRLPDEVKEPSSVDGDIAGETRRVLAEMMDALVDQDHERLRELFAEDVRALSDGGDYAAATRPIEGRDRVLAFLQGLQRQNPPPSKISFQHTNAGSSLVADFDDPKPRRAPRVAIQADVSSEGLIDALYFVMADEKVAHLDVQPGGAQRVE